MKFSVISEKNGDSFAAFLSLTFSLFGFFVLLLFPDAAAASAKKAVYVCIETLLPSLFPFFVFSNLAVSFGFSGVCKKLFSRVMRPVFRTSSATAAPLVLGLISGFPVGASSSARLYANGEISKSDCEKALTFSNSPSAGFIVAAVGLGVFKSAAVGWRLYFTVLFSSFLSAFFTCRLFGGEPAAGENIRGTNAKISFIPEFLSAVVSAGKSVLRVSAFVVFFSVVCGVISAVLPLSRSVSAALAGFFEISAGASALLPVKSPEILALAASLLSWSGLSVHFQVLSQTFPVGISPVPYLFSKLFAAVIASAVSFAAVFLFGIP